MALFQAVWVEAALAMVVLVALVEAVLAEVLRAEDGPDQTFACRARSGKPFCDVALRASTASGVRTISSTCRPAVVKLLCVQSNLVE